jgi:hypothetical protein
MLVRFQFLVVLHYVFDSLEIGLRSFLDDAGHCAAAVGRRRGQAVERFLQFRVAAVILKTGGRTLNDLVLDIILHRVGDFLADLFRHLFDQLGAEHHVERSLQNGLEQRTRAVMHIIQLGFRIVAEFYASIQDTDAE